jgi:hypothetical protein
MGFSVQCGDGRTLAVTVHQVFCCKIRCCYITVDFATAASQNEFSTYKLSLHKKNIHRMAKNIRLFITFSIHHRAVLGKNHYMPLISGSKAKSTNSWHFDQENYGSRTRRTTTGIKSRRTTLW